MRVSEAKDQIKISFLSLPIYTDELISELNIVIRRANTFIRWSFRFPRRIIIGISNLFKIFTDWQKCNHLQNDFYHRNNLNQMLEVSLFHFVLFFISVFDAIIAIFLSKSVLSINSKISNISTNPFSFIFTLIILAVLHYNQIGEIFSLNV